MIGFPRLPIKPLWGSLAVFAVVTCLCLSGAAEAGGRGGLTPQDVYAPGWQDGAPAIAAGQAWGGASRVVDEATRWLGQANPTGTVGPWCADFVSFVLRRVGLPPLPNRLAASAYRYGTRVDAPRVGDLAVAPHHVGFVAGVEPDGSIRLLSGNWNRRVAEATVGRRGLVFVRP